MKHYAFAALVMSTPFTWSYLTKMSGFLVRPFDILGIALAFLLILSGKLRLNAFTIRCIALFLLLVLWMAIAVIFSDYDHSPIAIFKISYYLVVSIVISNYILNSGFSLKYSHFSVLIISFIAFLLVSKNEAVGAVQQLIEQSTIRPERAIYTFWNKIFNINFFGASQVIEVKGVSFRNTSSLGFLTLALISYGFIKNKVFNNILTPFFIFLVLLLQSRVAIVCACIFVIMIILSSREIRSFFTALLIVASVSVALVSDFIFSITLARFNSGTGSRLSLFEEGLRKMSDAALFGQGDAAVVANLAGDDKTVHNVAVALGAEYGFVAFILTIAILMLCFYSIIKFSLKWLGTRDREAKKLYAVFTVAACVTFIRPNFSASADNFFSIAEWVCFSIVAAGHSFSHQRRHSQIKEVPSKAARA